MEEEFMRFENTADKKKIKAVLDSWYDAHCGHGKQTEAVWYQPYTRPMCEEDAKASLKAYCDKHDCRAAYVEYTDASPTTALEKAETAAAEAYDRYMERNRKTFYTPETANAKHIICKKCDSALSVAFLRGNYCPVCRADLRPETELEAVKSLEQELVKAEETLKHAKRRKGARGKRYLMYLLRV